MVDCIGLCGCLDYCDVVVESVCPDTTDEDFSGNL